MKDVYSKICRQIVPVLKQEESVLAMSTGAFLRHSMAACPFLVTDCIVPYKEQVDRFLNYYHAAEDCRVILVTDDEKAALKAAGLMVEQRKILYQMQEEYGDEDWEYDILDWEEEEDGFGDEFTEKLYGILDIRDNPAAEKPDMSPFLIAEEYWNGEKSYPGVMFLGLASAFDRKKYIQAVACCKKKTILLHIPKKLKEDVDVQSLIYEQGFRMFELPENEDAYYEALALAMAEKGCHKFYDGFDAASFVRLCRQKWQTDFSEDRIAALFDYAAENAQIDGRNEILPKDFEPLLYLDKKDAYEELMEKTGLDALKEISRKFIACELEKKRNPKAKTMRRHMLFYGKPGTGKTTGAELLAKIMREKGIGNGKFVVATRKDLIGQFVGHTTPRVAAKFEEAKGGILFVDEAGFFNQEETGGYVREALKEFIRYMENCEDVTVIFAMYPREEQNFLKLDDGMTSRIAHIVRFEDYDNSQLAAIACEMVSGRGYHMPAGAGGVLEEYFRKLKLNNRETFGNARECRKLVDELVLEISLRNMEKAVKNPNDISMKELKKVLARSFQTSEDAKGKFGFQILQDTNKTAVL